MLKKAKVAFLLVIALVFAVQGIGMETALAAPETWEAEEVCLENILAYMSDIASYGAVAKDYTQHSHSEANVFVDELHYAGEPPILASNRTGISNAGSAVSATVNLPMLHFADNMTFGLFVKEGDNYVLIEGSEENVNVEGKTEVTVEFDSIDGAAYVNKELYVMQVENDTYVRENTANSDEMTVEYGPSVSSRATSVTYIGSIANDKLPPEKNLIRLFQNDDDEVMQGHYDGLDLGSDLMLYRKDGDEYKRLDLQENWAPTNKVYIRDKDWAEGRYCELGDLSFDGENFWVYAVDDPPKAHKIEINFLNTDTKAASKLEELTDLSYNLANSELTIGGKLKAFTTPSVEGNSTVTSPIADDGTVVSLYAIDEFTTYVDSGTGRTTYVPNLKDIYPEGVTTDAMFDNHGLPLADNEYAVINIVMPAPTEGIQLQIHGLGVQIANSDGSKDKADKDAWAAGNAANFGRLIWNPVYQGSDGKYYPYTGYVMAGQQHGGTVLAPAGHIFARQTSEATTLIAQTVECFDEIHQNSFQATSTYVRMRNENEVEVTGKKTWANEPDGYTGRPESIEVTLYAAYYVEGFMGYGYYGTPQAIKTITVTPDENGNWSWRFEGLPKFDGKPIFGWENGVVILYTVQEKEIEKYDSSSTQNNNALGPKYQLNITNIYNEKKIVIKGEKSGTMPTTKMVCARMKLH